MSNWDSEDHHRMNELREMTSEEVREMIEESRTWTRVGEPETQTYGGVLTTVEHWVKYDEDGEHRSITRTACGTAAQMDAWQEEVSERVE